MIPQKRLKYEKWNGCDNVIIIDLHNGYSVVAIWSQNENEFYEFSVTLHIKENSIDRWDLIVDDWKFTATRGSINAAILKTVADGLEDEFFKPFIEQCKYYIECENIGSNIKESKGNE